MQSALGMQGSSVCSYLVTHMRECLCCSCRLRPAGSSQAQARVLAHGWQIVAWHVTTELNAVTAIKSGEMG